MRHGFDAIRRRTTDRLSEEVEIGLSGRTDSYSNPTENSRIDYGFTLASESGGGYRVSQEYATVQPSGRGSSDPFLFKIEDGRLTSPASQSQYNNKRFRLWQDDDEAGAFDTAELWLRRLARPWALGRSQESPEHDEAFTDLARPVDILLRRIASMRFYHIFPNTIREPQKLGNPYPLDEGRRKFSICVTGFRKGPEKYYRPS